jgi:hypothetical protein
MIFPAGFLEITDRHPQHVNARCDLMLGSHERGSAEIGGDFASKLLPHTIISSMDKGLCDRPEWLFQCHQQKQPSQEGLDGSHYTGTFRPSA